MITIENLHKSFGYCHAVAGIGFSVVPGEVLGFLGPNGAGKSTTMKMITGFIKPSEGCVSVFGHDVNKDPVNAKAMIGYLPEGAPAYGDMLVSQFLDFIAQIRGFRGAEKRQRVRNVVDKLALASVVNRPIDNLSKGFKRRVGIAQAILHDPRVLILDEPTDGLDPNQKHQVRELIRSLSKEKIVIISTHILEEVTAVCSRAIVIADGRVVADETPGALQEKSRYHKALTLEFEDGHIAVTDILEKIPGVSRLESTEPGRYTLFSESGASLFEPVSQKVAENGWKIKELFVEKGRLDDVFRALTQSASEREVV